MSAVARAKGAGVGEVLVNNQRGVWAVLWRALYIVPGGLEQLWEEG